MTGIAHRIGGEGQFSHLARQVLQLAEVTVSVLVLVFQLAKHLIPLFNQNKTNTD